MFKKSPDGNFCLRVFLCLIFTASVTTSSSVSAAPAFLTQDQNPFSLIHGLPQPVAAQLPEADSAQWSLTLDITNTLNTQSSSTENLFLDFESYNLRFAWLYGLNENWALKIELPLIYYGSGFLDNTIDSWHEFFHLPRANRPNVADNQLRIFYEKNNQTLINIDSADSSLADIQIAIGRKITATPDSTLSLWASADLATGEQNNLSSNASSDFSIWLAGDYRFNPDWSIDTNIGVLFTGENQIFSLPIEDKVLFAYMGVQWQAHTNFDLRLQINAHDAFYSDSELLLLGAAYNMVLGGRIHINACSDIDLAFSEDIQVGATPDISFLLSWKSHFDCSYEH